MVPQPASFLPTTTSETPSRARTVFTRRRRLSSISIPPSDYDKPPFLPPFLFTPTQKPYLILAVILFLATAAMTFSRTHAGHEPAWTAPRGNGTTSYRLEPEEEMLMGPRKANATIVMVVSDEGRNKTQVYSTLRNVEERFNARLGYAIQLLTEGELPSQEMRDITSELTGGKATWCEWPVLGSCATGSSRAS